MRIDSFLVKLTEPVLFRANLPFIKFLLLFGLVIVSVCKCNFEEDLTRQVADHTIFY